MKFKAIMILIVICSLLSSCQTIDNIISQNSYTLEVNEQINEADLNEIEALDRKLIENIQNYDIKAIQDIASEDFSDSINVEELGSFIVNINQLVNDLNEYTYINKYLCRFNILGTNEVKILTDETDIFNIKLAPHSFYQFVSLICLENKGASILMTNVYIKKMKIGS